MAYQDPQKLLLNELIVNELSIADQYRLHSQLYQKWGLRSLASQFKDESLVKLQQAQQIIDQQHILVDEISLDQISPLPIGSTIKACFIFDLKFERSVAKIYQQLFEQHADNFDNDFYQLLTCGLEESREQIDFISTQLQLIDRNGIKSYLQNELNFFNFWRMNTA